MDVDRSRVVFVCGITTTNFMLDSLQDFLSEQYPYRELIFISALYSYTEHSKITAIQKELLDILSDGEPTIVVGHSFGGVIVIATCQKYPQLTRNVERIITLGTPHYMNGFGILKAKQVLGYGYEPVSCPVFTVGAKQDVVVPHKYSHFPESTHQVIRGKHVDFLYPKNPWVGDFWSNVI